MDTEKEITEKEIKDASDNLVTIVQKLNHPILLTVSIVERFSIWLKIVSIIGTINLLCLLYFTLTIIPVIEEIKKTSKSQEYLSKQLETTLNVSSKDVLKAVQETKAEIKEQPKIVAEEEGKLSLMIPNPDAKKQTEDAKKRGISKSIPTYVRIEMDVDKFTDQQE